MKTPDSDSPDDPDAEDQAVTVRPRKNSGKPVVKHPPRRSGGFFKLILLVIIALALAPTLLTFSGQTSALLKKVHPELARCIRMESVNLHWWAPVHISRVQIFEVGHEDSDALSNALLCEIESVSTTQPLWQIALNAGRGTGLIVRSPRLNLVSDENGTNVTRTLESVFGSPSTKPADEWFPVLVLVEDGEVSLQAEQTHTAAKLSGIQARFSTMNTVQWLPELMLTANVASATDGSQDDQRIPQDEHISESVDQTRRRTVQLAAELDDVIRDLPTLPLESFADTDEVNDQAGSAIRIHLKPADEQNPRQTIQLGMRDLDLRLIQPLTAVLFPKMVCEGIVSCGLDARLGGATFHDGLAGRIQLEGNGIRFRHQDWVEGEWVVPGIVEASGGVAIAEDGMLIQDLKVQSRLLELSGAGEMRHRTGSGASRGDQEISREVRLSGSVDLAQLTMSLPGTLGLHEDVVVERGRLRFGIRGDAELSGAKETTAELPRMNRLPDNSLITGHWQLAVQLQDAIATRGGRPMKIDPELRLDGAGPFRSGIPALSKARLNASFGTVDFLPDGAGWIASGLVQPEKLWQQLSQFVDIPQPDIQGDISFYSRLLAKPGSVTLSELKVTSPALRASSSEFEILTSAPLTRMFNGTIHLEGRGAAFRLLVRPWHDAAWLADAADVIADVTAAPSQHIDLTVRVQPQNVANVQASGVRSVSRPHSDVGRPVRLLTTGVTRNSAFSVDEAELTLSLIAGNSGEEFQVQRGTIRLPGVAAVVQGLVRSVENDLAVDLTADTTYDLDVLSRRLLAPDLGFQLSGKGRDVFEVKGFPSALQGQNAAVTGPSGSAARRLEGSGTVNWISADLWGLPAGNGSLAATLQDHMIRCAPVQCSLGGGQLNMVPQYSLRSSRLQLGTGSRVQNVQLSPAVCRIWLGYVAPMLAEAAQIDGEISARVENFIWDFNHPNQSDITAQLSIHRAEAVPGSAAGSLIQVVDLLRRANAGSSDLSSRSLILPQQSIAVQLQNGYVRHDRLLMELAGYRMTTSGIVGLNSQLQMTIDVPLEKSTATTTGRSVSIPLRGTISNPQPDASALLQNLGTQKIQEKIGDQIDRSLNKKLDKLFDKF